MMSGYEPGFIVSVSRLGWLLCIRHVCIIKVSDALLGLWSVRPSGYGLILFSILR